MLPTDELKEEHRVILRMLGVIENAGRPGTEIAADFFPRVVDFVRNFADRCHHGKEEENLFTAMVKRGFPGQDGPIGVMLVEHDRGRDFIKKVEEAACRYSGGDKSAVGVAIENARRYASLLRQHIDKEDNVLYPMANNILSPADQKDLETKFAQIELERMGPAKHEGYLNMVADLERHVGIKSQGSSAVGN